MSTHRLCWLVAVVSLAAGCLEATVGESPSAEASPSPTPVENEADAGTPSQDFDAGTQVPSGPPSAPSGVTAVAGNGQVIVRWDAVAQAEAYRVYWKSGAGVTAQDARLDASSASVRHEGLSNGSTYHYAVAAVNALGESALSAEVSATPSVYPEASNWLMAGANPQRTSWVTEGATQGVQLKWYVPIEAYIDQKVQVIAAQGLVYLATSRGLLCFVADTGALAWRWDTELPLGHSPTVDVARGVLYAAGYDQKLHALDAATGAHLWDFAGATAGYDTNPLVAEGLVILGNRDGTVYAVGAHGTARQGQLVWSYKTAGPVHFSAAYKDGAVYVVSNDNHAYALVAGTGALVWKSDKLPGDGFHSFWPVVFRDKVIIGGPKGMAELRGLYPAQEPEGTLIGDVLPAQAWSQGFAVSRPWRQLEYTEANPDGDANRHKPHHRVYFALSRADGKEFTFDSDGDGHPEYLPFGAWGKPSGNHHPVVVDPNDRMLYGGANYACCSDAKGKVYGWVPEQPGLLSYVGTSLSTNGVPSPTGGWAAQAEPQALSGAGTGATEVIYRSLCCDRVGDWFGTSAPRRMGQFWSYNLGAQAPGWDVHWYVSPTAISRHIGWYTGTLRPASVNGQYGAHGDQNPLVPHRGHLFVHRSNALVAYGPGPVVGRLPVVPIRAAASTVVTPTVAVLKDRLEAEVREMMDAGGHLRPGWSTTSLHNYRHFQDYFLNPGETLLTLCMAFPHLSASLQTRVQGYLSTSLWPDYFEPTAYARMGLSEGVAREAPPLYPEVAGRSPTTKSVADNPAFAWSYPPHNLHAMAVCAKNVSALDKQRLYLVAKAKLRVPAAVTNEAQVFTDDPFQHNAWLTGYLGFLSLQDQAGMAQQDAALRAQVVAEKDRLLALRWTMFTKDSPWQARGVTYKKSLDLARNFLYLSPELGQLYRQNILARVQEALDEYTYVAPYWFAGRYEAFYGENVLQPLYTLPAMFQAKAWILGQSRAELYKHLDAPSWERGDLFYLQNLVVTLEAP